MKKIILATLLSFNAFSQVPLSWISESNPMKSILTEETTNSLSENYNNLLDHQGNLLNNLPTQNEKSWYLQSIKTELGVSLEGEIGLLGAGGEAALELVWIRKKNSTRSSSLKLHQDVLDTDNDSIQISSEMSEADLMNEINPVVDMAMASGKIRKRKFFTKNLFKEALQFQKVIRELDHIPQMGPWYPYKYQVELNVTAAGHITPIFEIGTTMRLRMEWWKIKKEGSPIMLQTPVEQLSAGAKTVAALVQDLSAVVAPEFDNGFRFNCMKIGVGATVEGDIFLAEAKAQAIGSIFLVRQEIQPAEMLMSAVSSEKFTLAKEEGRVELSREKFRRGIQKANNIASFFAKNAKTKEAGQFELNVIEAEFNFFTGGELGLVTVEGESVLTIFVTRNVVI